MTKLCLAIVAGDARGGDECRADIVSSYSEQWSLDTPAVITQAATMKQSCEGDKEANLANQIDKYLQFGKYQATRTWIFSSLLGKFDGTLLPAGCLVYLYSKIQTQ